MALDLKIVQQSKKIKIDPARLKKKQESINPWDRPVFLKKTTLEKQPRNKQSKTVIKRIKKRELKGDQTGIKAGSNWDQKLGSKRDQTGIKLGSKRDQNKGTGKETGITTGITTGIKEGSNWDQRGIKLGSKVRYCKLSGYQRKVMDVLFSESFKTGERFSPPLTIEFISFESKIPSKEALKVAIKRLLKKDFLIRHDFKNGRGGWTRYEIPEKVYNEIRQTETGIKVGSNWDQTGVTTGIKVGSQLGSNLSSSSSDLNTTTTSRCVKTDKNGYLDAVKIPEEIKKIGFRKTQVEQISKVGKLSVKELETSLEHFSFDLVEGHIRAKTNPLNMLMGILRHGVYTSSEYLKEEETALENELRGLRERKKRRDDLLKEKQELLFEEWLEPKSKDEIVAIVPTPMNSNEFYMQGIHKELLFNHFVENEMELFKGFQQ